MHDDAAEGAMRELFCGDGGCVIDVASGEIVVSGLSMPHSPRVHRGKLWLLESGTGQFGPVDVGAGRFEPMTFCPGYARGLGFVGYYAVAALSKPRDNKTFSGLALDANLAARYAEPLCGLLVIDLKRGDIVHWVRIEGIVEELYDVAVLEGVARPMAFGFRSDEIRLQLHALANKTARTAWAMMARCTYYQEPVSQGRGLCRTVDLAAESGPSSSPDNRLVSVGGAWRDGCEGGAEQMKGNDDRR